VTAAAVGAIAGAVVILARRSLIDWLTVGIALAVLATQLKLRRVPEPVLIVGAGIIGLVVHYSGS
jgi:chromate transporter